jgi:hypothetical protein
LPAKGNLAAEEAMAIERGVRAVPVESRAGLRVKSVFAPKLRWQSGNLKVCFWNGTPEMQARVATIADELVVNLPVKFEWLENGAIAKCSGGLLDVGAPWRRFAVRVSLSPAAGLLKEGDDPTAFFALLGRQSQDGRRATVNLPFTADDGEGKVRNKTLHEFCHVLGCLHEHQRELCAQDFNETRIRAKYHLSAEEYRDNFLVIPSGHAYGQVTTSTFDDKSVMLYELTRDMFNDGSVSKCIVDTPATKLSPVDAAGLQQAYAGGAGGAALSLKDFPALEQKFRAIAKAQNLLGQRLRTVSSKWQASVDSLDFDGSSDAAPIEQLASEASARAAEAEAEADSYDLTPSQAKAIKAALAYFPED